MVQYLTLFFASFGFIKSIFDYYLYLKKNDDNEVIVYHLLIWMTKVIDWL